MTDIDLETLQETQAAAIERLTEIVSNQSEQYEIQAEALADVERMLALEDVGWSSNFGFKGSGDLPGPDLDELKKQSGTIRQMIVGTPIIGRGAALRGSYVWSKGVTIPGSPDPGDKPKPGRKGALHRFIRDPLNERYLLSDAAHAEMEKAAFSDGIFVLLGDNSNKSVRPIPLEEITGIYMNPDYIGEIWAYKRSWTHMRPDGVGEVRNAWYYVDTHTGEKSASLGADGTPVDKSKTIIDQRFNTQVGWPLGVPDAVGAIRWARMYSKLMANGETMNEAMARFAYKVTNKSKAGANNVGVKMAGSPGSGQTAALGVENELQAMPNAGRTYDFNGLRPVASQVAAVLEVSNVHLLSDPGAAGSSYGSASNLDLPTKRAMVARQNIWASFLTRVLFWATGEYVDVSFPSLDDPDPYREGQLATMLWNTGTIHPDEFRPKALELGNFTNRNEKSPDGVLIPNNEKSLARKDIDADGLGTPETGASPDSGQSNGTGGTDSGLANDLRSDTVESQFRREEFLRELELLTTRIESATSNTQ